MTLIPRLMLALMFAVLAAAGGCDEEIAADGGAIVVPSGREVQLIDVITNAPGPEGATARFRFLAPGLVSDDLLEAADDMLALCQTYALPRTEGMVPTPAQIVISLASEAVPFGEAAPDVVQYFEGYRVEDGACIWAAF